MALPACGHTHRPFGLLVCPRCLLVSGRFLFPGEVSPGAPSAGGGAERRGRGGRSAELRCPRCRPVTPRGLWPELRALLCAARCLGGSQKALSRSVVCPRPGR